MFYKTNAGLGHNELAYFLKLNATDYLCLYKDYTEEDTLFGDSYTVGKIENDFEEYEIESTDFDITKSSICQNLLSILIEQVVKKEEKPKVVQKYFMDQLDGNKFADDFIMEIYNRLSSKTPLLDIEYRNLARDQHIVDGQIITVWLKERIIATANIMRTPLNYTHVVCNKITENIDLNNLR